ncbi:tyrosine-type recombinase/integrase [Falsirhodobacter halotolerans]|uniref:tyrosine-type recombinase/integrase n=1 Tax=Falsirhodobacter halotolerans TaxID=1146892 RepID=UPI001FD42CB8|nr:recombinase [Falsirhodobacter halotolerans]MCJ8138566.1 recombinase [Falsirhodobacter halotolerans]
MAGAAGSRIMSKPAFPRAINRRKTSVHSDPFKAALWDGSDPLYAPCMRRVKRWFYWRPPARYVTAGYSKNPIRLPGEADDGQDAARAQTSRDLTREMLRWFNASEALVEPGTWQWLIGRYKSDEFSPFREVKENTRADYLFSLVRWEEAIGKTLIAETDHIAMKRWQKAMTDKGRSVAYIKRMFTMLRIVTSYGVIIKDRHAREVQAILGEMRIKAPKARTVSPSGDQVAAIITKADEAGQSAFALGILLQWWLTLRAVDVRGQWLGSGADRRWADGLTWDMVDKDLSVIRKTPSKTEASLVEVLEFPVVPEIRVRLAAIPQDQRIGPVIKMADGKPFEKRYWAALWRRFAKAAGVPDEVQMRDTRAGAINHARSLGATPMELQHQANHADFKTTERYVRERSSTIRKVIELRARTSKQPT